jgi:hypothetical protein
MDNLMDCLRYIIICKENQLFDVIVYPSFGLLCPFFRCFSKIALIYGNERVWILHKFYQKLINS